MKLSKSIIGQEEIDAVTDVLQRGYLGMGQDVMKFEEELECFFQRNVTLVNTGTAALHLALQGVGIGWGDEVLVQSLTYVACFQAIKATGATPVACEVCDASLTLDLADAEAKLTPRTKAIMPVHYAGNVGDLDCIYDFARKHRLRVIEDASHAFGSFYKGKLVGSFGDVCCVTYVVECIIFHLLFPSMRICYTVLLYLKFRLLHFKLGGSGLAYLYLAYPFW